MNFEPIGDRILIKPNPKTEELAGLELLEGDRKEDPIGTVMEVGTGVPLYNINLKVDAVATQEVMDQIERVVKLIETGRTIKFAPGDIVMYGKFAGTRVVLDGEEYIIIREQDVFGKFKQD